ncbi:MAG: hypothetical protein ACRDF7_09000 [Candidatus Limnocylindrales bacterium]
MAKSIAEKLLIKPDAALWVWPPARVGLIGRLPPAAFAAEGFASAAVVVLFVDDAASARAALAAYHELLANPPILWIAYPKGNRTDVNRDTLWPMVAEHGLRPITQIAIDEVWSALRFRRIAPGEGPFVGPG